MYTVVEDRDFRHSYLKLAHSGRLKPRVKAELERVVEMLRKRKPLPARNRDHALTGEWLGYRECHIKGDLLLIYQTREDMLVLVLIDIGSHSQLFG
ncbi:MAG: hypothetical protein A2854_01320 [Parcubacteria group bacterium RIFCSPHIGHO2_01_FULL_56_18]|nr:MAG: hypothetical protein A2854_01320 [Parcubacteria group bacterium RIFCSPHIGHO2_01_FULL_56_18]